MEEKFYKRYEDLPLFLNAQDLKNLFGISLTAVYSLLHQKDFPSIRLGKRFVVAKDELQKWIQNNQKERK